MVNPEHFDLRTELGLNHHQETLPERSAWQSHVPRARNTHGKFTEVTDLGKVTVGHLAQALSQISSSYANKPSREQLSKA